MKTLTFFKSCAVALSVMAVAVFAVTAQATGPRVSPGAFVPVENEIFAAEQPPFISATMEKAGLVTAVANSALEAAGVEAVITTLPLRSVVQYHLIQEQALAALGSRFTFADADKGVLSFVPVLASQTHYVYYRPAHAAALNWDGSLKSLAGLRYGALKGEDVAPYKNAGIDIVFGSERSLLKKLKSGQVDFVRLTPLATDWLLDKHLPSDKASFAKMERPAGDVVFSMIFNTQHKNAAAVSASLKSTLRAMHGDGRYAKVLAGYLKNDKAVQAYVKMLNKHLK
ncbi:hypothetical protein ACFL12_03680 [Pseudomonadota bacterium]